MSFAEWKQKQTTSNNFVKLMQFATLVCRKYTVSQTKTIPNVCNLHYISGINII